MFNNKTKRADIVKWISVALAIMLVSITLAGLFFGWFTTAEKTEIGETDSNAVFASADTNNVKMSIRRLNVDEYTTNAAVATASSAYTLKATVLPSDATDATLTMSTAWTNPSSTWASGKSVSSYLTVTSAGTNTWTLSVVEAFGEQITITVTAPNYVSGDTTSSNLALKATCMVDYVKRIKNVQLYYTDAASGVISTGMSYAKIKFGGSTTIGYIVSYGVGTVSGTFTGDAVDLKLTDALYNACNTATTSGNVIKSANWLSFADLSSASSKKITVGKCTYFLSSTGDPGSSYSQWQSAMYTYCSNNSTTKHATLSMPWTYTYNGVSFGSGTATTNVYFDAASIAIDVSSVSLDSTSLYL